MIWPFKRTYKSSSPLIARLLNHKQIRPAKPAPQKNIQEIESRIGMPLPPVLVELWSLADGVKFISGDAEILSTAELLRDLRSGEGLTDLINCGYLPFLDEHESNYLCIHTKPPLAPRVSFVPHDDGPRLIFRSVESSLQFLSSHLDSDDMITGLLYEEFGDYPLDGRRTAEDQEAGKVLLSMDHELHEWNFATQLLDESNLAEWSRLLETDHFVRRDVRERMEKMPSDEIKELLARDRTDFEQFALHLAKIAQIAGLNVGTSDDDALQINQMWIALEVFYHRRHIREADIRMINWIKDLSAGQDPHKRPDHFMLD